MKNENNQESMKVFQDPWSGLFHAKMRIITPEKQIAYQMDPNGYPTMDEALTAYDKNERAFAEKLNTKKNAQKQRPTFKNELLSWYHNIFKPRVDTSTEAVNALVLYNFLLPNMGELGDTLIQKITITDIDKLLAYCDTFCATSGAQTYKFLKGFFRYAFEERLIRSDIYKYVKPYYFSSEQIHFPPYTKAQLATLLKRAYCGNHFLEIVLMSCGLRLGEVRGLRYEDFNKDESLVHVRLQLVRKNAVTYEDEKVAMTKIGVELKAPKTASSDRILRLPPIIFDLVQERKNYIDSLRNSRKKKTQSWDDSTDGFLCVSELGRFKCESTINAELKRICVNCGLPIISSHDLRHISSTLMVACVIEAQEAPIDANYNPLQVVADYLGHANVTTTFDIYISYIKELSQVRQVLAENVDPFNLTYAGYQKEGVNICV